MAGALCILSIELLLVHILSGRRRHINGACIKEKKPSMLIDHLDGEQTKGKFRNIERKRSAWEKGKMHLIRRFGGVYALVNCLLSERKVILRPKVSGRRGPLMII